MDEQTMCYTHEHYTITTFEDEGEWWVRARVIEKNAEGARSLAAREKTNWD